MPVSFTIVADMYPFEKRAQVIGILGSAWGIASIIGPLLGGFIVDSLSWHWIFFINVPIGLLTIVLLACFFSMSSPIKDAAARRGGNYMAGHLFISTNGGFSATKQPTYKLSSVR